jgi:hypothetical protein
VADRVDQTINVSVEGTDTVKAEYAAMSAKLEEMNKKFAAQGKESEALKSKLEGLTAASSNLGGAQDKTTKTTKKSSRAALDNARAIGNLQDGMVALLQATTHTRSGFVNGLRAFDNFGRVLAVLAPKLGILGFALSGLVVVVRGLADRFFDLGKSAKDAEKKLADLKVEAKAVRGVISGLQKDIGNAILPLEKLIELRRLGREAAAAEARAAAAGAKATVALSGAKAELAKREAAHINAKTKLKEATEKQNAAQGELSGRFATTAEELARKNGYVGKLQQLEINADKASRAFEAQKQVLAGIADEYNKASAQALRLREQEEKLRASLITPFGPANQKDDDCPIVRRGAGKKEPDLKFFNAQQAAATEMQGAIEGARAKAIEKGIAQRLALFDKETSQMRRKFEFFALNTENFDTARNEQRIRMQTEFLVKRVTTQADADFKAAQARLAKEEMFERGLNDRRFAIASQSDEQELHRQAVVHGQELAAAFEHGNDMIALRKVQEQERTALIAQHAKKNAEIQILERRRFMEGTSSVIGAIGDLASAFGATERQIAVIKGLQASADALKNTADAFAAFATPLGFYSGVQYTAAAASNVAAAAAYFKIAGTAKSKPTIKVSGRGGGGTRSRQPSDRDLGGEGRSTRQNTVNVNNFNGHFYDTREGAGRALGDFVTRGQSANAERTGRARLNPQAIDQSQSGRRR